MDSVTCTQFTLKEAIDEYKTDPRRDWYGFSGDFPSDERKDNYLRLLLSDTSEASHDALTISQYLETFLGKAPKNLEELKEAGEALKIILESPFFDSSLLTLPQIDDFIREMAPYEMDAKRLRRRIRLMLSRYKEDVFRVPREKLKLIIDDPSSKEFKKIKAFFDKGKRYEKKLDNEEVILLSKRVLWIKNESIRLKDKEREYSFTSSLFKDIDTNWKEYASSLREYRNGIKVIGGLKSEDFSSLQTAIMRGIRRIEDLFHRYGDSLEKIKDLFASPLLPLTYSTLEEKASNSLSSFDKLPLWVKYRDVFNDNISELDVIFSPQEEETIVEEDKEEEVIIEEEKSDIVFPPYASYDIIPRSKELGVESSSSLNFSSLLRDLLETLAPILERDALRILFAFDGEEAKKRALELKGTEYEERNGFWYLESREIKFRESSIRRDFSHIAPEELLDGMLTILSYYKEMTKEELYNKLGEKCGMKSVLSVRYKELDKVLFSSERIEINGEHIRLVESVV